MNSATHMAVERTIWYTMVVDFVKAAIFAVRGSEREGGPPTLSGTAAPSGVGGGSGGWCLHVGNAGSGGSAYP